MRLHLLPESYLRLRHSYGHGVHSPYSYNLVKRVLTPGRYGYYGYEDIEASLAGRGLSDRRLERRARRLLRFIAEEDIRSLFLPEDADPIYETAAKSVFSGMRITHRPEEASECDLVLTSGAKLPLNMLESIVKRNGASLVALSLPGDWKGKLSETMDCGVMFESPEVTVFLCRSHISRISYTVRI